MRPTRLLARRATTAGVTASSSARRVALDAPAASAADAALAARADQLAQLLASSIGCAVDRDDAVARLAGPARRAGAAGHHFAEHRLAAGLPMPMRCISLASTSRGLERSSARPTRRWPRPSRIADQQVDALAAQHRLRQLPAQVVERAHVVPFDAVAANQARDPVAGAQAGPLGDAGRPPAGRASPSAPRRRSSARPHTAATASSRLATGPAATMAARCHSGLRVEGAVRARRGATGAFALVEHRT